MTCSIMSVPHGADQRTIRTAHLDSTAPPAAQRGTSTHTGDTDQYINQCIRCLTVLLSIVSLWSVHPLQHSMIPEHHGAPAQEDAGIRCDVINQLFPEIISRVPLVKADLSVPVLHENLTDKVRTCSNADPDPDVTCTCHLWCSSGVRWERLNQQIPKDPPLLCL